MKKICTKKNIFKFTLIFIIVLLLSNIINSNANNNSQYQESINRLENIIQIKSEPITDKGFVLETLESLKILSFINFCNTLDQRLLFLNIIYILSILFIGIRVYFQRQFNQLNIPVILPKLSITCISIYTFWIFTFSSKISIIQMLFIYTYILLSLELIKQIRINSKSNIKNNSKHDNIDLLVVALIPLTMIGFKAIPMTYVILGTIPYCIYAYVKVNKTAKKEYIS